MAVLLKTDSISKSFGVRALFRGISLSLDDQQHVGLIGPNGAGKSTLFNILAGQLRADAGVVEFDGRPITGLPSHVIARRGVGRTFQITATFATLTALENVQVARVSHRRRTAALLTPAARLEAERALALLAEVGLAEHAARRAGELAYGDLKKLELAIALAGEPTLLLLDEPTAGMAAAERVSLMGLTVSIARERGLTVLFTEHDMDVVFAAADRIVVLHEGRVIADGLPSAVREDRQVQAVYLGEDD